MLGVLASGFFALSTVAAQREPASTRVVRCKPGVDVPCAVVAVDLETADARREPNDTTGRWWTGRLGSAEMSGTHVRVDNENSPAWKLLILLDLSGSMRGDGLRYARTGLRAFIRSLPQQGVAVGIAPFESRQVSARIASARFGSPEDALKILDGLPPPDAAGNTALYSALVAGLDRLGAEMKAAAADTRGGLLLLTDGKNDVGGRADDPGLLAGLTGRRTAADAAAGAGRSVWLVGVGNVDREELGALAGQKGEAMVDALDAVALANRFAYINRQIAADREITLVVRAPSAALLSRSTGSGLLWGGADKNAVAVERSLDWRPPLLALPAYDGVADAGTVPADVDIGVDDDWNRRLIVSIAFGLLWLALTVAMPAMFSAPVRATTGSQPENRETVPLTKTASSGPRDERSTGLRTDVKEAPPRKPDEITASSARRVSAAK